MRADPAVLLALAGGSLVRTEVYINHEADTERTVFRFVRTGEDAGRHLRHVRGG